MIGLPCLDVQGSLTSNIGHISGGWYTAGLQFY